MIRELTPEAAVYIARNLRPEDHEEVMALRWQDDPTALAKSVYASKGVSWEALDKDGMPFAMFGVTFPWPGMGNPWFLATREAGKDESSEIVWFCRKVLNKLMKTGKFRQMTIYSAETHKQAHRLIRAVGFKKKPKRLEQWGKAGETFLMFQRFEERKVA